MSNSDKFWYFVGLMVSSPVNVLGLFLLLMTVVMLCWAQFGRSKIDLAYLLVDSAVGNVTLAKFGGFGAFIASTWVFCGQFATGKFDGGYATTYLLTWAGVKVAADFAQGRESKKPEPSSTVETTTLKREVSVQPNPAEAATDVEPRRPLPSAIRTIKA